MSKKTSQSDGCGGGVKGGKGYMSLLAPAGDVAADAAPTRPGALDAVRLVLRSMRSSGTTAAEDRQA